MPKYANIPIDISSILATFAQKINPTIEIKIQDARN